MFNKTKKYKQTDAGKRQQIIYKMKIQDNQCKKIFTLLVEAL